MDEINHLLQAAARSLHLFVIKLRAFPDRLDLSLDAAPAGIHAFRGHGASPWSVLGFGLLYVFNGSAGDQVSRFVTMPSVQLAHQQTDFTFHTVLFPPEDRR